LTPKMYSTQSIGPRFQTEVNFGDKVTQGGSRESRRDSLKGESIRGEQKGKRGQGTFRGTASKRGG